MTANFEILQDNEVITFNNDGIRKYLSLPPTCLVKDVKNAIAQKTCEEPEKSQEILEGISCEVLQFSQQGWKTGKIKISVEFLEDH
jgi:hypothetical protein